MIAQETDKVLSKRDKKTSNKGKRMSDVFYAQNLFREAFPQRRYGSVKAALYEAHRFISRRVRKDFTERRVRSLWEGTAKRVDAEEMEALKAALMEEGHREQRELRARLASLDEKLAGYAAAAHRETMAG
ncbi:hypothetical protein [Rhizobium sp. Root1204]|uniref:hypothetical protein n=1 Tax=Rhizobium sp. Root1204 TaxID=1736428 RepID=UPI000713B423|nr:hypothetical protein [Rhizobium sp. Root1204]KQV31119.1 hypothetical protein ASC96_07975 [Rhizobium sp. Root1204]